MKKKAIKPIVRSVIAQDLATSKYHARVVVSKKLYSRKRDFDRFLTP